MNLESEINKQGGNLVRCGLNCEGITRDPNKGILPRCLYYESSKHPKSLGVVIVGINPGRAKKQEMDFYLSKRLSYDWEVQYWKENLQNHKYYKSLRHFVKQLNIKGDIIWTELVKCQSSKQNLPFNLRNFSETFRTCTHKYLKEELKLIQTDWPIIAVGGETYTALAFLFTDRQVIGLPHPTGSYGHFDRLFVGNNLKSKYKLSLKSNKRKAIWLPSL